jgi:hypothetical protein
MARAHRSCNSTLPASLSPMSKPVKIALAAAAIVLAALVTVAIVDDRKLVNAAEQVKTREQFAEFKRSCPSNTTVESRHSGYTQIYCIPFVLPVFRREIEFHCPGGKWPPSISSEIVFAWRWFPLCLHRPREHRRRTITLPRAAIDHAAEPSRHGGRIIAGQRVPLCGFHKPSIQ